MENIFEKADFTAGSDHKERLRKELFSAAKSDKGTASAEEVKDIISETRKGVEEAGVILDDAELDKAAGGYHAGYSSRTSQKFW